MTELEALQAENDFNKRRWSELAKELEALQQELSDCKEAYEILFKKYHADKSCETCRDYKPCTIYDYASCNPKVFSCCYYEPKDKE